MRLLLALPLALAACTAYPAGAPSDPSATASPGTFERTLPLGEGTLLGDQYSLSFVDVTADSRCPVDVTCVWAGEAKVVVGPSHPTMRFRPDTLRLSGGRSDSMTVGPFVVKVARLDPAPRQGRTIAKADYRATFAVRRAR